MYNGWGKGDTASLAQVKGNKMDLLAAPKQSRGENVRRNLLGWTSGTTVEVPKLQFLKQPWHKIQKQKALQPGTNKVLFRFMLCSLPGYSRKQSKESCCCSVSLVILLYVCILLV